MRVCLKDERREESYIINISAMATIADLKESICATLDIRASDLCHLSHQGKAIQDDSSYSNKRKCAAIYPYSKIVVILSRKTSLIGGMMRSQVVDKDDDLDDHFRRVDDNETLEFMSRRNNSESIQARRKMPLHSGDLYETLCNQSAFA